MAAKLFNEYLSQKDRFTKALFDRPDSLSKFLTYEEFISDYNIFANRDGSLGAIFDINLVEHEPLSGDEIVEKVALTKAFFSVPDNCVLQVIHEQSPISKLDKKWDEVQEFYPAPSSLSERVLKNKIQTYKKLCTEDNEFRPLRRKTFFCIKYYPTKRNQRLYRSIIKNGDNLLPEEVKAFVTDLREFDKILKDIEVIKGLNFRRINADELVESLRRFFNPKEFYKRDFVSYNPNLSISDQVIYNSLELSYESLSRENVKTKSISLKNCPRYGLPGGMASFLKLNFPYRVCLNISLPKKNKVKNSLGLKAFFLENTPTAESRKLKDDLDLVEEKLAHDDRCLQMTFTIVIEGETDEQIDERTRKILSIFKHDLECEAIKETDIGLGLCLNSLPLMYSSDTDFSTRRSIKILRSDLQNFLPIFDSYKGTKEPMQLFLSRENNLVPFSIINENRNSNHSCVVADTGSGKSAFVLDCVQAYKRLNPDPIIFYVEKRASSKMLCRYFDGEVTEFQIGKNIPFSPFRGKFDDSKVNFLTLLIGSAVKLTSPSFVVESEHSSIIGQSLKLAYKRKCEETAIQYQDGDFVSTGEEDKVINMDDVINSMGSLHEDENFKSMSAQIDELVTKLRDFYGDGKYADFFRGNGSNSNKNYSFYVYDLDGLESDPTLQALVTLSIFSEIRRIISLDENRGRGGLIVFEEMGQLGKNNPTAAKYVVDFAETIRKLGFWLISIAPRPENFFTSDAGKAAWESADNYFFMQLKPDSVNYIKENSSVLNETTSSIVKSIRTVKDLYADVFYTNKDGTESGAFRFLRTPIDRWIAPTNSTDNHIAEEAYKEIGEAGKTLDHLLEFSKNDENMEVA